MHSGTLSYVSTLVNTATDAAANSETPALVIVGDCDVELWSMPAAERHRRSFARVGVLPLEHSDRDKQKAIVAVRADFLLGPDIVAALVTRRGAVLAAGNPMVAVAAHVAGGDAAQIVELLEKDSITPDVTLPEGCALVTPDELGSNYDNVLRKRATPLVLSYSDTPIETLESRTFGAAYKGATDFVTKWLWPRPARTVTRWAAKHGISPNSVTTASLLLVFLASWMFANAYFLAAIPVAWAMTFLDTVDGKLARVTLTSSAWGNIYDHGIDLIHPPFWWWAWYVGVLPTASKAIAPLLEPALIIVLAGYVLGRVLEGLFVLAFKIETHIWRPIDYFFRTITARRNPNLAILTVATLVGRPDAGLIAVAAWTVISLAFHTVRLVQAAMWQSRGNAVASWLQQS